MGVLIAGACLWFGVKTLYFSRLGDMERGIDAALSGVVVQPVVPSGPGSLDVADPIGDLGIVLAGGVAPGVESGAAGSSSVAGAWVVASGDKICFTVSIDGN